MRDVKFRAWDKFTGSYSKNSMSIAHYSSGTFGIECGNRYTLEQYTGLKDKTGEEIWEGDIIAWHVNDTKSTAPVIYDTGAFWMDKDKESGFLVCNDWYRGEYEVIGNIHDNPELLEGGR